MENTTGYKVTANRGILKQFDRLTLIDETKRSTKTALCYIDLA